MIKPTIGRVVLIRNRRFKIGTQDEPALICYVHSDTMINVGGFDADGKPFNLTSLALHQVEEAAPEGQHAAWMPYQKAVAAGEIPAVKHAKE